MNSKSLTILFTSFLFLLLLSCGEKNGRNSEERMNQEFIRDVLYRHGVTREHNSSSRKGYKKLKSGTSYHPDLKEIVEDTSEIIRVRETAMMMLLLSKTVSESFTEAVTFGLKYDKDKSRPKQVGGLNAATKNNYGSDEIGEELLDYLNSEKVLTTVEALKALTINKMVHKIPELKLISLLNGVKSHNRVIYTIEAVKTMEFLTENLEFELRKIASEQSYRAYTTNLAKKTLEKFGRSD